MDDGRLLALGAAAGVAAIGALMGRGGSRAMETHAAACAPQAHPGLRGELRPGEILVYRTSRSAGETEAICAALARGRPQEAFRASVHMAHNIAGHTAKSYGKALERAEKQGKVPLFTSPYVTAAAIYRDLTGHVVGEKNADRGTLDPVTWAIAVPESAVIWTNSRTHNTQGIFYTLTYSDAELVIDARQVRAIWHVPLALLAPIVDRVDALAKVNLAKAGFRDAYRDRDEPIARAALDAVLDLRVPPTALGRPFLEAPVALSTGIEVQKGDRVLLLDGQVVTLTGQSGKYLQSKGMIEWGKTTPSWGWDGLNLEHVAVVRVLAPKEVVKAAEKEATWRANRWELRAILEARLAEWDGYVKRAQIEDNAAWAERLQENMRRVRALLPLLERDTPPWKK